MCSLVQKKEKGGEQKHIIFIELWLKNESRWELSLLLHLSKEKVNKMPLSYDYGKVY